MMGRKGFNANKVLLWVIVYDWTKDDRPCFKLNRTFGKDLGLSNRSITSILNWLKINSYLRERYEGDEDSGKRRCLYAIRPDLKELGRTLHTTGKKRREGANKSAPKRTQILHALPEGNFTHTRTDTTSTTKSSIKMDEGSKEWTERMFLERSSAFEISRSVVKDWAAEFYEKFHRDGRWSDKHGKDIQDVEQYAHNHLDYRLEKAMPNGVRRKKEVVIDKEKIRREINWHHKRLCSFEAAGNEERANTERAAIQRLEQQLDYSA